MDLLPLKTALCMGRHSPGVFGREDLNFRLIFWINLRSARFSNVGFCTSVQGYHDSRCSSAPFGKLFALMTFFGRGRFFPIVLSSCVL